MTQYYVHTYKKKGEYAIESKLWDCPQQSHNSFIYLASMGLYIFLYIIYKNINIHPINTDVNFYLIEILNNQNSTKVTDNLLDRNNILVRDCKSFKGMNNRFIRVSIKTPKENNKLFKALEKTLWNQNKSWFKVHPQGQVRP